MKKLLIASTFFVAPLFANAYTWDQTIDFNPNPQLSPLSTFTYTHDITTDGFNAGVDNVAGYTLSVNLLNDNGALDIVYIDQPGLTGDSAALLYNWNYASLTTGDSYQGIASLNANGLLNISITSLFGTFFLDSSTLVATGTQGDAHAVPEPTSVALLAAGLLGIAVMRRNSKAS